MHINKKPLILILGVLIVIGFSFWRDYEKKRKEREIVFGWMSDVHYGDNNHGDKLATLGDDAIERVMPEIIKKGADFNIVTGDMIDNFHKTHEEVISFHKKVKELYDNYSLRTYFVIGNHDVESTTKDEVTEIYQMPAKNYVFQESGITFIVLDQQFNLDGSSYDDGEHYIAGAVHEEQINWFRGELKKAPGKVIVLLHQPIYSVAEEDGVSGELYTHNGDLLQKAMEESGKVLAVLTGHKQPTKEEMDRTFNGVRHLMIPSAIFKETRLSYGIIRIDLKTNKLKFEYYSDKNQQKLKKQYDEVIDECKGPDEEEDYYAIMKIKEGDPEKFKKLEIFFDKYKNSDFRNNSKLSDKTKKILKDFEDYECYSRYLEIRNEYAGY
jgi:predicted MPP superfamily phosphohydrolase